MYVAKITLVVLVSGVAHPNFLQQKLVQALPRICSNNFKMKGDFISLAHQANNLQKQKKVTSSRISSGDL